ncbi:hypothetical protein [Granulicella sp. L46]|uniref:hypothetical protein n=1 Tax=Granulicella sp. L46 TaxID=1641865 RepID=UPI00131C25A8|nr:hypothetical protein [Granulicella sp. L46]
MTHYHTRSLGLASYLRHTLGADAHLSTTKVDDGRNVSFIFHDPKDQCPRWAKAFFSPQGAPVTDARALLEASRDIRLTMTAAIKTGIWQSEK